jgi:hypothetical protein
VRIGQCRRDTGDEQVSYGLDVRADVLRVRVRGRAEGSGFAGVGEERAAERDQVVVL